MLARLSESGAWENCYYFIKFLNFSVSYKALLTNDYNISG